MRLTVFVLSLLAGCDDDIAAITDQGPAEDMTNIGNDLTAVFQEDLARPNADLTLLSSADLSRGDAATADAGVDMAAACDVTSCGAAVCGPSSCGFRCGGCSMGKSCSGGVCVNCAQGCTDDNGDKICPGEPGLRNCTDGTRVCTCEGQNIWLCTPTCL